MTWKVSEICFRVNFSQKTQTIVKFSKVFVFFLDIWSEISPILWEVLKQVDTVLGPSRLDSLLAGARGKEERLLTPLLLPWSRFVCDFLAQSPSQESSQGPFQGPSQERLLALLSELKNLREEAQFWTRHPKVIAACLTLWHVWICGTVAVQLFTYGTGTDPDLAF